MPFSVIVTGTPQFTEPLHIEHADQFELDVQNALQQSRRDFDKASNRDKAREIRDAAQIQTALRASMVPMGVSEGRHRAIVHEYQAPPANMPIVSQVNDRCIVYVEAYNLRCDELQKLQDIKDCNDRLLAFCEGLHPRLSQDSPLFQMHQDVSASIFK